MVDAGSDVGLSTCSWLRKVDPVVCSKMEIVYGSFSLELGIILFVLRTIKKQVFTIEKSRL